MHQRAFEAWAIQLTAALGCTLLGCNRTETASKSEPNAAAVEPLAPPTLPAPPAAAPSAAASSASATAGAAPGSDPCVNLCARSRELGCAHAGECPAECREMLNGAACADPLGVALRCFVAQPTASFECGDNGVASVKDGICDSEQAGYVRCLASATVTAP